MSSISAQGVVERASAELSKRINGLGLRSKHHHGHGKTSVMERVTNALCGGSSQSIGAPEKPSRMSSAKQLVSGKLSSSSSATNGGGSQQGTPQLLRKMPVSTLNANAATTNASGNGSGSSGTPSANMLIAMNAMSHITSMDQLLMDERFLAKFFQYFTSFERRTLAQVCTRWRDVLYRSPRYWSGILPALQCRELRHMTNQDRVKLYNSLIRRGFHAIGLLGATDEDALDIVHSFPLASKHIHSLSLRCASVSDRGLEALLDHLQVSRKFKREQKHRIYSYLSIDRMKKLIEICFNLFLSISVLHARTQSLFELELAGCNEVTEAGLWSCLTPRIVSLSLADCINIADEAVGAVAQLLPSLYEFSLQVIRIRPSPHISANSVALIAFFLILSRFHRTHRLITLRMRR